MVPPAPVAIVTGSGGAGCGRAIALRFARDGAAVVVSDTNQAGRHETVRLIGLTGGRAAFFKADVRDEAQARALIAFATGTFASVDVLVNNASAPHPTAAGIAGWFESLQTDLFGTLYATRYAVEAMRAGRSSTSRRFRRSGMAEPRRAGSPDTTSRKPGSSG